MSRYIDADALLSKGQFVVRMNDYGEYFVTVEEINKMPTVDAVQVVRKPIRGYEGMYEVDNLARVFSVERVKTVNDNGRVYDKPIQAKQLRQWMHSKGYKVVTLTKDGVSKTHFVHRLVAEAFIENPNGLPMINHKDEDKTNNLPENLEWCDAYYNVMYGNGRKKRSKKIKGVPLSEEHKRKISESLKRFYCADGERRSDEQ
jgi:hypothetical protein